jgi:hypothetical protein
MRIVVENELVGMLEEAQGPFEIPCCEKEAAM